MGSFWLGARFTRVELALSVRHRVGITGGHLRFWDNSTVLWIVFDGNLDLKGVTNPLKCVYL